MQPQRCPRCRSTWTERKLSPRSRQSSRGSRKVVGDCAGGFHMAAGTVPGAASIYLRFIIQPTAAPDVTPTTSVVAIVARRLRLQMSTRARGSQPRILSCTTTIGAPCWLQRFSSPVSYRGSARCHSQNCTQSWIERPDDLLKRVIASTNTSSIRNEGKLDLCLNRLFMR